MLADEISNELKAPVSYNTLRRFFGLVSYDGGFSRTTLDLLARYSGYHSFYEVELGASPPYPMQEVNRIILDAYEGSFSQKELLVVLQKLSYPDQVDVFKQLLIVSFRSRNFGFIRKFFEFEMLFRNRQQLDVRLYQTMLMLGNELRREPLGQVRELWAEWAENPFARKFYFELFVDVDNLNTRHRYAMLEYMRHAESAEEKMFAWSLLARRALSVGDAAEAKRFAEGLEVMLESNMGSVHGIPLARALGVLMEQRYKEGVSLQPQTDLLKRIDALLCKSSKKYERIPFFHYWVCSSLIVVGEDELVLSMIQSARKNFIRTDSYYTHGAECRMYVYQAIARMRLGQPPPPELMRINENDFFPFSRRVDSLFLYYALELAGELSEERRKKMNDYLLDGGVAKPRPLFGSQ